MSPIPRRRARRCWSSAVLAIVCLSALSTGGAAPAHARSSDQRAPSIVGGVESPTNAYPWMTAVGVGSTWSCAGTLVSPTYVLTSAACVTSIPGPLNVLIGQSDLLHGSGGELRAVAEVVVHPGFTSATSGFDVAVLRLTSASTKAPLAIVSSAERALWTSGVMARTLGWGRTSWQGPTSPRLREVEVMVQADAAMTSPQSYGNAFKPATMLGAGFMTGGSDTCTGDEGGPLVTRVGSSWRQIGVTSWGDVCAAANKPGIYTRIGAAVINDWIRGLVADAVVDGQGGRSRDFDGDGRDDVAVGRNVSTGELRVARSMGTSFVLTQQRAWYAFATGPGFVHLIGDVDGDRRSDAITFRRSTTGAVQVSTSAAPTVTGTWLGVFATGDQIPAVGDFNGDGRDDIAAFTRSTTADVYVALSTGTSFGPMTTWQTWFAAGTQLPAVADVNGDGRDDIVAFTRGSAADVFVALSTGTSFGPVMRWHDSFASGASFPAVGDFNGDRRDDIAMFSRGSSADVHVALSTGTSFGPVVKWHDSFVAGEEIPGVGDFNGDGKDDIVRYDRALGDVYVSLSSGTRFVPNATKGHDDLAFDADVPLGAQLW